MSRSDLRVNPALDLAGASGDGRRASRKPEDTIPRRHNDEAQGKRPPYPDRYGQVMYREEAKRKPDKWELHVGEHARCSRPPDARLQDHDEARHRNRKHREHAGSE